MSLDKQPAPPKPFERVMVFIDGGNLRKLCRDFFGHDNIDFKKLHQELILLFNNMSNYPFQANFIRIYYYDAIVPKTDKDFETQEKYFGSVRNRMWYTVRLGKLVKSSKRGKYRQKGVDILMAVDALTKVDQYETGIFVVGDGDYLPLIEAVKDAGNKTLILCYKPNTPIYLQQSFDMRIWFAKEDMKRWLK